MEEKNELDEMLQFDSVDEEVLVTNTSMFNKEGYVRLNTILGFKSKVAFGILALIMAGLAILFYVQKEWFYAIFLTIFVVTYPLLMFVLVKHSMNKTFETYNNKYSGAKYEYNFKSDKIDIYFSSKEQVKSTINLKYSSIYKVIEDNDYVFVFISANQAYIIDRNGFGNQNDVEKINEIFRKNNIKLVIKNKR